jgi:thiol-disulfide isomerase/thioredoxin
MMQKNLLTRAALAAILLAVLVPAASLAQKGFQPTGDYTVVIDGKPAAAEVFQNQTPPSLLVLTSSLSSPVLLTPRAGTVETVNLMKVAKQSNGSVDLLTGAVVAPAGQFQMQGENVTFTYEGKKVSLNPRPPLTGLQNAAALKAHSPEYLRTAQGYNPNGQAIAALKKGTQPVTVRVVFGSWCPHCKEHIPYLLKVEDQLKGSKIKFEYFGLPRPPEGWKHPEVKRLGINGVPTGIVYVNGKEVGRITGKGWDAPEVLLSRIVNNVAGGQQQGR